MIDMGLATEDQIATYRAQQASLPKPGYRRRLRWWWWRMLDRLGFAIHRRLGTSYCERED